MSSKRILGESQRILGYIGRYPGAFAAAFVGVCLILNERSGRRDIKEDLADKIDRVRTDMATKTDLKELKMAMKTGFKELKTESANTQAIALGSAYATMKTLSGERKMTNTWMGHIEKCIAHGGEACDPIKGIATVYGNSAG